jgi:hypothetical protein
MTIRNLIAALGVLSLSSAGAMAADLALKAAPLAPPPPSWTGFYIGVTVAPVGLPRQTASISAGSGSAAQPRCRCIRKA